MAQLCARCSKPPTTLASLKIEIERSESFALTVKAPREEELQAQTATQDRLQAWRSVHNVRPCQQAKSTQLGTDHVIGRKEVVHFRQDGANDAYPQLIANLPTAESTTVAVTKRSFPRLDSVGYTQSYECMYESFSSDFASKYPSSWPATAHASMVPHSQSIGPDPKFPELCV